MTGRKHYPSLLLPSMLMSTSLDSLSTHSRRHHTSYLPHPVPCGVIIIESIEEGTNITCPPKYFLNQTLKENFQSCVFCYRSSRIQFCKSWRQPAKLVNVNRTIITVLPSLPSEFISCMASSEERKERMGRGKVREKQKRILSFKASQQEERRSGEQKPFLFTYGQNVISAPTNPHVS